MPSAWKNSTAQRGPPYTTTAVLGSKHKEERRGTKTLNIDREEFPSYIKNDRPQRARRADAGFPRSPTRNLFLKPYQEVR